MGRTTPSLRRALDAELGRLRRIAEASPDPALREAMLRAIGDARALLDAYQLAGEGDPLELALLSMIVSLYRRLGRCRGS